MKYRLFVIPVFAMALSSLLFIFPANAEVSEIPDSDPGVSETPSDENDTAVPPSDPVDAISPFPDVALNHPNIFAINWAKNQGIISGYEDGTFRDSKPVSRVEILKVIYLASGIGEPTTSAPSGFGDLDADAWYISYVRQARQDNVIQGYPDGEFKADRQVSRVEAIKIAFRVYNISLNEVSSDNFYSDIADGHWSLPYVNLVSNAQLMDIVGNQFKPDEGMARKDMVELLHRMKIALADGRIRQLSPNEVNPNDTTITEQESDDTDLASTETGNLSGSGIASYYSDSLAGNHTANGEIYDPEKFTCAHKTLPFGTVVKITNPDNGATTNCRINDRGPYAHQRVLDLSRVAFEAIENLSAGITHVEWTVVSAE